MYPGSPSLAWEKDGGQRRVGWDHFRSRQEIRLLTSCLPRPTPRLVGRGTCTHTSTIRNKRHHPFQQSLPSYWWKSTQFCKQFLVWFQLGKWLLKEEVWQLLILVLMSSAMLLTPKQALKEPPSSICECLNSV